MSIRTHSRSRTLAVDARPRVQPSRRRLDWRFPSVAFTVTADLPWVEVLLATDPALFDPARAGARTPATFYASRSDGGLTPTVQGRARYVAPADAVERLSANGSLWYLAVGYPDATGSGGVPSSPTGASGTIVVEKSRRVADRINARHRSLSRALGNDAVDDRRAGEDGADLALTPVARSQAPEPDDRRQGEDGADLAATSRPPSRPQPVPPAVPPPEPVVPLSLADYQDDYEDQWGSLNGTTVPALATSGPSDDYPDIDWGDVPMPGPVDDRPAYRSLEGDDRPTPALPSLDLSAETQRRIIEIVAGADGSAYGAVNADGPYRGRHGPGHKAFQRYHTGLSYGIAEFGQDSGTLGQLLTLMRERDPQTFGSIFGPASDALLAVTTAPGPSGEHVEGDRGPRVQPVDGADLWEEPWLSRFRAAGEVPAFRAAQNQLAAELFLAPMLPLAAGFGLTGERTLAMVLDRAFVLGEQGAKRWLADTVGPIQTHAQRHDALAALGFASVEAFQAAVPGLLTDGEFGPMTQATLAAALRALGTASPLPVPDPQQAVEAMARRGRGEEGAARLVRLAAAPDLSDAPVGG